MWAVGGTEAYWICYYGRDLIGIEAITRAEIEAETEMESVVETGVESEAKVWEQRLQVEGSRPVVKALSRHCDRDPEI